MKIPCEDCICLPMCKGKAGLIHCSIMEKVLEEKYEKISDEIFSIFPNGAKFATAQNKIHFYIIYKVSLL